MTAEQLEHRYQFEWEDFETATLVNALDAPLLVIHDENDRIVPVAHGAAVAQAAPRGSLHTTSGLGHRGILIDAGVVTKTVEFLGSARDARPQQVPA
jgi:pimeloyl-ACP methyl ester carboxylesterase